MRITALAAFAIAALACGGNSTPAVSGNDDAGVPTVPTAGTYKATPTSTSRSAIAAVGPAMETTLIAEWSGAFSMVLPNYDFLRGAFSVKPDGTLQVGTGLVLAHQDGTVSPATLAGTSAASTLVGTINGTEPFSLTLTTIQNQDFTVAKMAGNYTSTSTSTGTWVSIALGASGSIQGYAYASQADMQAGIALRAGGYIDTKAVGHYLGTITHTDVPVSCPTCVPTPNSFNIGFAYEDFASGARHAATYGYAYFTTGGLVALTVNPGSGEQLTATFSKQ